MVGQVILHFDPEHGLSPHCELFLKADKCTDILVIGSNVIKQCDNSFTVNCGLNSGIATIESMFTKHMFDLMETSRVHLSITGIVQRETLLDFGRTAS